MCCIRFTTVVVDGIVVIKSPTTACISEALRRFPSSSVTQLAVVSKFLSSIIEAPQKGWLPLLQRRDTFKILHFILLYEV